MTENGTIKWAEEAEVIVVGYGGAGATAAITAHDAGAKVLIIEKQQMDTPSQTRHTPSTRMSGGAWFCSPNEEKTTLYLEGMAKIANETLDPERKKMIRVFSHYLADNTAWLKNVGVELGGIESISPTFATSPEFENEMVDGRLPLADFPQLPGSDGSFISFSKAIGMYRNGAALFKRLSEACQNKNIQVMWGTQVTKLLTRNGKVSGVKATTGGKEISVKASRSVILSSGGFEFDDLMKEHFLRVNPVHFYGNPSNTGDGIKMSMDVGAALWHMNSAAWRVTMKFRDFPVAFGTQNHSSSVFIDRKGDRFANERFNMHSFGYELTNYDSYSMCYPKIPCYWIFDEKRRTSGPLASYNGVCNPPGGIMGDIHYIWSTDNQKEIARGWIMRATNIEALAKTILADSDNGDLMSLGSLKATIKRYNKYCRSGKDLDFKKQKKWLQPIEDGPFYAVKLWPGGPNTQGGPKRNESGQILRVDNRPIPGLYSAGELGSFWGMLYQAGGNIADCIAFGRIAGVNAATERRSR